MTKLKINNIKLVIIYLYYHCFTNVDVILPNDLEENETVCGCIIFVILLIAIMIGIMFGLTSIINLII